LRRDPIDPDTAIESISIADGADANIVRETAPIITRNVADSRLPPRSPGETAPTAKPPSTATAVPENERRINIWIGEGDTSLHRELKIGQTYTINFKVGAPVAASLTSGPGAAVPSADIPAGGLPVEWLVIACHAELAAGTPDTTVTATTIDGVQTWAGRFNLLIPETGDSAVPQLKIKPLKADPLIDVVITTRGEVYRKLKIALAASDSPGVQQTDSSRVVGELMLAPTAQIGLRTTHEWTTPDTVMNISVIGSQATVKGYTRSDDVDAIVPWLGVQSQVSGPIDKVREAAEQLRAAWESHFDDVDPADLADRLSRWGKGSGGPEYNWSAPGNYADPAHEQKWQAMAVSAELRTLALRGKTLFQAVFPAASDLNGWISALSPGARLNISWTPLSGAGFIPHVPWGLMYLGEVPPAGQPVDPMGFLGLHCRVAYTSHYVKPGSRSLGAIDATHRAHFLYWGDAANDVTGREARWQRSQWGGWQNQVFFPDTVPALQNAKAGLLKLLDNPEPAPTSLLYFFCQCTEDANSTRLRFGATNDSINEVTPLEFGTTALAARPLVFVNACTTAAADPYRANDLEQSFFDRDCRAYLGTETKVPIVLGSRFATVFFHFFYRLLDPQPMSAGEALSQTRLFLWTHYRNIGGLFYCYVNQYDLFLASGDEVLALRRQGVE
jgi:hypothetical protein